MRDPDRIEPLLEKLAQAWHKYPDMRFGQLMACFFTECKRDPFYVEDEMWMTALQAFIEGKDPAKALDEYLR